MARRRRALKRRISPDPRYNNVELGRFINKLMLNGKKTTAQHIVYKALQHVEAQSHRPALEVFGQAIKNATPMLEVRSRRVGGATYQVPTEVKPERRNSLAMRWIILSARARQGKPMFDKLAQELLEASRGQGASVKRKEDLHRMAEANRAFVHYRW